ncbi:MAG: F0F1 ATP synthase subunit delta, partial [Woeseia sp.]
MTDNHTIARPYAQAVFELARERKALAELSDALAVARDLLSDGQAAEFLANPSLTDDERLSFLTELFKSAGGRSLVFAGESERGTN